MFERYNIDELYLASINVMYSEKQTIGGYGLGGVSLEGAIEGFGYITVVKKDENKYIDLQNPKRILTTERDKDKISYIIEYIEPLKKYYTQEGKKKYGKRKTLKLAENYYEDYHKSHMNYIDKKMGKIYK